MRECELLDKRPLLFKGPLDESNDFRKKLFYSNYTRDSEESGIISLLPRATQTLY